MAERKLLYPGQKEPSTKGKVRLVSFIGKCGVSETTEDISAFDVVLPIKVKGKGAMLNLISAHFFKATEDIIPNCLLSTPHPRFAIWKRTTPFMFEVIVRAYDTGSFYAEFTKKGIKNPWGYELPDGSKKDQKFPELLVTPTTKAEQGDHDRPITRKGIVRQGLATASQYEYIHNKALELFKRGQEMAAARGLILVDTKYEFGVLDDTIYLIDEVHTPDSSRYWYADEYEDRFAKGEDQKQLSKEFVREWLKAQGYQGRAEDVMPEFPADFADSITDRYVELYERLTGNHVDLGVMKSWTDDENVYEKVCKALIKARSELEEPQVAILMGSDSDLPVMEKAAAILTKFGVTFEMGVASAHRTPGYVEKYASSARRRGIQVIIAGAGGAAHLPGVIKGYTTLPVIGIPVKSSNSMNGLDSLLSIVQMPPGVPVATVGIDAGDNAALLALDILGTSDRDIEFLLDEHKLELKKKVDTMREKMSVNYAFTGS